MRFFNTAGPVNCSDHYCLPPMERLNLDEILLLIHQKKYFVLHAPRQTGKTTCLLALMAQLNETGAFRRLYCNVEPAQAARENVEEAMRAILNEMSLTAGYYLRDDFLKTNWRRVLSEAGPFSALSTVLSEWAVASPAPLVILLDEIDSLVGDTLISVLRQLRAGYTRRPAFFPQSVILCGVRDVRDYRIHSAREKEIITGGSVFNIKAESLRLGDFSKDEVFSLYSQHAEETGQAFEPGVLERIWDLTQGQPWLVNALGYELCFRMPEGRDRSGPIMLDMVEHAKENLILRRETHLDQLADKLKEDRVRRVIEPILAGLGDPKKIPTDDLYYVRDLGLIRADGHIGIANGIYQEVIPRELTYTTQLTISNEPLWYIRPDGRLDITKLMLAFQEFFREHAEHWIERFDYKEAGPQLLLQAFLQRIVNSGGRIEREYGLGMMRTDLLVLWPVIRRAEASQPKGVRTSGVRSQKAETGMGVGGEVQKVVIELKLLYKSLEKTTAEGLIQTAKYMDRCAAEEGHLVIFDRSPGKSWDDKIFRRDEEVQNRSITVWGM